MSIGKPTGTMCSHVDANVEVSENASQDGQSTRQADDICD